MKNVYKYIEAQGEPVKAKVEARGVLLYYPAKTVHISALPSTNTENDCTEMKKRYPHIEIDWIVLDTKKVL